MYNVTAEEANKAIAEVLSKRIFLPDVAPDSIGVETVVMGQFLRFHLRMNKNYKVLPSPEKVKNTYEQSGKQGEGAKYLMLGALQITGDQLRATARIVAVETALVKQAAKGDGEVSYEGLCKAFETAFRNLLISYVC